MGLPGLTIVQIGRESLKRYAKGAERIQIKILIAHRHIVRCSPKNVIEIVYFANDA